MDTNAKTGWTAGPRYSQTVDLEDNCDTLFDYVQQKSSSMNDDGHLESLWSVMSYVSLNPVLGVNAQQSQQPRRQQQPQPQPLQPQPPQQPRRQQPLNSQPPQPQLMQPQPLPRPELQQPEWMRAAGKKSEVRVPSVSGKSSSATWQTGEYSVCWSAEVEAPSGSEGNARATWNNVPAVSCDHTPDACKFGLEAPRRTEFFEVEADREAPGNAGDACNPQGSLELRHSSSDERSDFQHQQLIDAIRRQLDSQAESENENGRERFAESGRERFAESGRERFAENGRERLVESGRERFAESGREQLVESGREQLVEVPYGETNPGSTGDDWSNAFSSVDYDNPSSVGYQQLDLEAEYDPTIAQASYAASGNESFEPNIWWGSGAENATPASKSPSYDGLSYNELRSLRDVLDSASDQVKATATKRFLAKKADEAPTTPRKKKDVPEEKPPVTPKATMPEYIAFGAFLIYVLLASVGAIRIDSDNLIGPRIGGGNSASAKATTEEMRTANLNEANAQIEKARDLTKSGNRKDAFAAVDRSLKLSPTSEAYTQRARMSMGLGYTTTAINDYDRAIEIKKDPSLIYERAQAHLSMKNMKAAAADFTSVLEYGPKADSFRVYALRARAYSESGRMQDAVRDYKKAIAIAPEGAIEVTGYKNELAKLVKKAPRKRSH